MLFMRLPLVLVKGSICVLSTSHYTPIPTVRHSIRNIRTLARIGFDKGTHLFFAVRGTAAPRKLDNFNQ